MKRTRCCACLTIFFVMTGFLAAGCVPPGAELESGADSKLPVAQTSPTPEAQLAAARSPRSRAVTYLQVGIRLLAANQPELALKAFTASIGADGMSSEALTGAGIASQRLGMLTAARRYFDRARDLAPNSILAQNNLGVVLFLMKEYYPAREAFKVAFALSSGQSEIAERNLNRAEFVVAEIEKAGQPDPEISHRVVRLGTSAFRITPTDDLRPELMAPE